MVVTTGVLLLISAGMHFLVWPPFLLRRVMRDPRARDDRGESTGFQRFNLALLVLSFLVGLLSLVFGLLLLLSPSLIAVR